MVLKWDDDGGNEVWSAIVIGNGKDYEIHWSTVGQTLTVTKLYQYEGRLYIRENANGSLYYSYHTDDELGEIAVMYNYTALDDVVDVDHMLVCTVLSGQISFGTVYAPSFTTGGQSIFDDVLVNGTLTVLGDSNLKDIKGETLTLAVTDNEDNTNTILTASEDGITANVDTTFNGVVTIGDLD